MIGQSEHMSDVRDHWDRIYATRSSTEVSWYERSPTTSLRLIESVASGPSAAVIDVGGGASELVDRLLREGFTDLTVMDISEHALDEVRQRLAGQAPPVRFVHDNVLTWEPDRRYDVWHDRAVFHFLTAPADRDRYVDIASRAVRDGGVAVVGTFDEDGPTHCSGLPVTRYSPQDLGAAFAAAFSPIGYEREEHITPAGVVQPFTWAVLRRT
jgi:SAM-dependent methyltransferase